MIYNEKTYFEELSKKEDVHTEKRQISLVTDPKQIMRFASEHDHDTDLGFISNLPYYIFRMDIYKNEDTGSLFRYCNIEYPKGGAAILVVFNLDNKKYYMLNYQYRPFLGKYHWEIPRGFAEMDDKSAIQTMIRELKEECGLIIAKTHEVRSLGCINTDSGLTNNTVELFLVEYTIAQCCIPNKSEGIMTCQLIPEEKLLEMIRNNEITDAFTLSALLKYNYMESLQV